MGYTLKLRIWRGDKSGGEIKDYPVEVSEGEVVLDNCIGSGTTAIAAMNTGRRFVGIEKDPAHYATACERVEKNRRPHLASIADHMATFGPLFRDTP